MDQVRIFVSHTFEDKPFCDALVAALRDAGADAWYDEQSMGAGHLLNVIQRELVARPVFVVVISKAAFASMWVTREWQAAFNLYSREPNRVILPVTAQPIEPSDFSTWPDWLFLESFRRIEAPGYKPLPQQEAIAQTLHTLVLTPSSETPKAADVAAPAMKRETASVLWVDDNPSNNYFERRSLEELGITFTLSTSTEDAVNKLVSNRYDAVISDMSRPPNNLAGYELLDEVRWLNITAPFIIYCSSRRPEQVADAKRRGAYGQTNSPNELFDLVTAALGMR